MDISKKYNHIIVAYTLIVYIFFSLNLIFKFDLMWGLNHLLFIKEPIAFLFIIPFTIVFLSTRFIKESFWENLLEKKMYYLIFVSNLSFSIFILAFTTFLYFFRIETFFLGDGYAWIANFSNPEFFLIKPTEFLSSYIIRGVQFLLGANSKETSLLAFQIISIFSGVLFFFNLKNIINIIFDNKQVKVFAFLSFLFSGLTLLFMGYVEFYPILWMSTSLYVYFGLKSFTSSKYLVWGILFFIITLLMHAQAIYLSFGFIYVLVWRKFDIDKTKRYVKKHITQVSLISTVLSLATIYIMYQNNKISQILLPLFSSNPENPSYFVFSFMHLLDILNLILLLFPMLIVFAIIFILDFKKIKFDTFSIYLTSSSIGSLLFLLFINPYIGFARDWDLMSMTLFLPILLIFYLIEKTQIKLSGSSIIIVLFLSLTFTSSFIFLNIDKNKSLSRYESILFSRQGLQFRPGWTILFNYYIENSLPKKATVLQNEMKSRFIDYYKFNNAYTFIDSGKYQDAYTISNYLTKAYPKNIDFIQLRGSIFMEMQNFDSAQYYFEKALQIQSTYPPVLKFYGDLLLRKGDYKTAITILEKGKSVSHGRTDIVELLASGYIRFGKIDKAIEIAKTFYLKDKQSPSYYIISMFIYLQNKNKEKAVYHYQKFLEFGKDRDDYEQIKHDFAFLTNVSQ